MSWGRNRTKRRGVALVFALFTISLLVTMSATVVALAIRHGRTSHSHGYAEAALHAANWGVEATLNYMGVSQRQPGGEQHWKAVDRDKNGYAISFRLAETEGSNCRLALRLDRRTTPVTVYARVKAAAQPVAGNSRLVQFCSSSSWDDSKEHELLIDGQTKARVQVLVTEYLVTGQPSHYQLVSTARVLNPSNQVVATRVVEARVREQTALDFMHFIQNARAWDVNGVDPGTATTNDIVGLPEGYRENGRMRVDGGGSVDQTAGSVKFYGRGDSESTRWSFTGDVTMGDGRDSILFTHDQADKNLNTIFTGGLKTDQKPLGLPHHEGYVEYAQSLAQGRFNIEIKGDPSTAFAASTNPSGKVPDVVKKENDARPSFARIVVTLNGTDVKIEKVNPGAPGCVDPVIYEGSAAKIPNGIVSVQGGNVEVQSARDNAGQPIPFKGNLTIVASDNPGRAQPTTGTRAYGKNNGTIYSDAARDFYTKNPHRVPPYAESEIHPGSGSPNKYLWPSPPAKYEREGNVMVTSDIQQGKSAKPPALGLIAQNFVLLNDKAPGPNQTGLESLQVEAVLMSLDHSVQFDWDNVAGSPKDVHDKLMVKRPPASTPIDKQRTFKLKGAIVSGFLDVEGDCVGRGYFNQQFTHDPNLRFQLPPSFPRWDRVTSDATGVVWNWVIMNYVDKGTLNQFRFD